jgi:hypothetical protein
LWTALRHAASLLLCALTLDLLNQATQAWVEEEYHRTLHTEIGTTPLMHYLAGPNVRRDYPVSTVLSAAFRVKVARRQRHSDGTVSLAGERFEIPARYRHLTGFVRKGLPVLTMGATMHF